MSVLETYLRQLRDIHAYYEHVKANATVGKTSWLTRYKVCLNGQVNPFRGNGIK